MGSSNKPNGNMSWAQELEREYTYRGKKPEGDGWMTFHEIRVEMKCGVVKCRKIIQEATSRGDIETFMGSSESKSTGTLTRQVWYRRVKD